MNGPLDFEILLHAALEARAAAHQLRSRRTLRAIDATHVEIDGRQYTNFASNDYLGLTHHPKVIAAAQAAAKEYGVGSGASAMVTGYTPAHASAEAAIARWKGTEAAVLLPSGYQANLAAVQAIVASARATGHDVRFLLDKLVHASLIDAVRSAETPHRIFPHNGLVKLDRLLADSDADEIQIVVTESIFSMDGDAADLEGIAALKRSRRFVLILDEAHGSGVYGDAGAGYAAERGLSDIVDLSVITLSKAIGVVGGAVCGSKALCDAIVNFGRAYLFSTSVPPMIAAAIEAAINVVRDEPERQQRVRATARWVRDELRTLRVPIPAEARVTCAGVNPSSFSRRAHAARSSGKRGVDAAAKHHDGIAKHHDCISADSPIIPVIFGSEEAAIAEAERLMEAGLLVTPIRPPTVAKGTSRLRITLSSEHTDDDVKLLLNQAEGWAKCS